MPPHPAGDGPESAYQAYCATDIKPAIRAATATQMRGILTAITANLCHHLAEPVGGVPPLGPDHRRPWQVCHAGAGIRAGLQIYRHVMQAVAGHYLRAAGFDPDQAAASPAYLTGVVEPFLAAARPRRLRQSLLDLAACIDVTNLDAATATAASVPEDLPEDVWDIGIGVSAGIGLYQHAVHVLTVHVLYFAWDGLGIEGPACACPN